MERIESLPTRIFAIIFEGHLHSSEEVSDQHWIEASGSAATVARSGHFTFFTNLLLSLTDETLEN